MYIYIYIPHIYTHIGLLCAYTRVHVWYRKSLRVYMCNIQHTQNAEKVYTCICIYVSICVWYIKSLRVYMCNIQHTQNAEKGYMRTCIYMCCDTIVYMGDMHKCEDTCAYMCMYVLAHTFVYVWYTSAKRMQRMTTCVWLYVYVWICVIYYMCDIFCCICVVYVWCKSAERMQRMTTCVWLYVYVWICVIHYMCGIFCCVWYMCDVQVRRECRGWLCACDSVFMCVHVWYIICVV